MRITVNKKIRERLSADRMFIVETLDIGNVEAYQLCYAGIVFRHSPSHPIRYAFSTVLQDGGINQTACPNILFGTEKKDFSFTEASDGLL